MYISYIGSEQMFCFSMVILDFEVQEGRTDDGSNWFR